MFPVAFISPKNWINCHRELGINLITTWAYFQSTDKHTFNDFSLNTNVQMWPMGRPYILYCFLCILIWSLKAFLFPFFFFFFDTFHFKANLTGLTQKMVGNLKVLFWTVVFQSWELWDQSLSEQTKLNDIVEMSLISQLNVFVIF